MSRRAANQVGARAIAGGSAISSRLRTGAALALALVALAAPAVAQGDVFGPISLVSGGFAAGVGEGSYLQADYAHDSAISGDGGYVAFDGSVGGVTGVWRRDLATGAIEQVAGGDAQLPSISESGQYVSFTTNEGASLPAITDGQPDAHPQQEAVNVYVRDMDVPVPATGKCESQSCPFTIASARNGSEEPLSYAGASTFYGSVAAGRSALSANGQEVAFVTTAPSDLADPGTPSEPTTPALQVAVRYLQSETTRLVSGHYEPASGTTTEAPVSETESNNEKYGAVYPGRGIRQFAPIPAYGQYSDPPPGASISADGTAVAWMGESIGEQVPLLSAETLEPRYTEPLWRRIAPGSETATERVTGGSDPLNPACIASGETALPQTPAPGDPCQGPFNAPKNTIPPGLMAGSTENDFVPRLSADGYAVAFVAQAPLVALGADFGRGDAAQPSDLYVADMHPGLTRVQALTELTELAGAESSGIANIAPIVDFDISPDASQVAFTTRRTKFPLGVPAYISPPAAEPGMDELFDVDLGDETLTRVTQGFEGGPTEHPHPLRRTGEDPYEDEGDGALSPSFSADGDQLAFSSTAANLVFGDGNTPVETGIGSFDGSDAFLVQRVIFGTQPDPQFVYPVLGAPAGALPWQLGVTVASRRDGSAVLYIEVPGAGILRAGARSAVPIGGSVPRPRSARRAGARPRALAERRGAVRRARARQRVATRTVSGAGAHPAAGGLVVLVLRLATPYAALASADGGLSASVQLSFAAPGHRTLKSTIEVTFVRGGTRRKAVGKGSRATRRSAARSAARRSAAHRGARR